MFRPNESFKIFNEFHSIFQATNINIIRLATAVFYIKNLVIIRVIYKTLRCMK
jgi:hypothetical protein